MFSFDFDIKPSFFDEPPSLEEFSLWKPLPNILKKFSDVRHIEGILFKRSKRTSFWKSRYYVLFDDRLAYFKNGRERKETAYCNIQNMRMEIIKNSENEKDEKHGIKLIQNEKSMELYARSQEVQEKWIEKLKQFCILTTYDTQYENVKLIGEGSFAKVYLAKKATEEIELAVKTFEKRKLCSVEKAKASLINEINIMRRLTHENIIKLHEVHESETHIYLVLELLKGGELFERIVKKGFYTEKNAAILMQKLLSALEYIHAKGIMHRDIKPENLILKGLENNYDVKIADFGLATVVAQSEYLFRRCGTPGYVAPEILADEKYDQKVDIFSAGVILYILLTGTSPFPGKSYNEILIKNKQCDINFNLKEKNYGISEQAIDLLRKMLQKDPKKRATAKACLEHSWIVMGGCMGQEKPHSNQLTSAQENMRKFQEQDRFNVKMIKPKDLDHSHVEKIERSIHCPSPVITGRLTTIVESKFKTPDAKKSKFGNSTIDETEESTMQPDEKEIPTRMARYSINSNNFNLITKIKSNSSCSSNNTPLSIPQVKMNQDNTFMKRVMNVQGNLLNLIRANPDEHKQGPTITSVFEAKKDKEIKKNVSTVKSNLRNLF